MENTKDLSKFGQRELKIAGELLSTLNTNKDQTKFLGQGVSVEFNPMSGNVFLTDEDYNVAMMNGDVLEDWLYCPECGDEGFADDFESNDTNHCCKEYLQEVS